MGQNEAPMACGDGFSAMLLMSGEGRKGRAVAVDGPIVASGSFGSGEGDTTDW
jgi:hypothetical protein